MTSLQRRSPCASPLAPLASMWQRWPRRLRHPRNGVAHVWSCSAPLLDRTLVDHPDLSDQERIAAARFHEPSDQRRYAAAHVLLRRLLGAYVGTSARSVALTRDACPLCSGRHGRPALAPPHEELCFSLSHSSEQLVVAVAGIPIGVDVESVPTPASLCGFDAYLHRVEAEELRRQPSQSRPRAFAQLWTRKEAYLKGLGTGLARDLSQDYLGEEEPKRPRGWTTIDVAVPEGYAAAVSGRADT
ncbi:MAG: 4-phosphopantetheinyl transferase, partial [Actinomycetota bacterium]|nr:4-phosphopantetheinyl transferase [Actinomycetota bacterium]